MNCLGDAKLMLNAFLFGFGAGIAATYLLSLTVVVCLFLHGAQDAV